MAGVTKTESHDGTPHDKDVAPGDDETDHADVGEQVRRYLVGLALAFGLTAASFWAISTSVIYGPAVPVAVMVLAVAQMGVHLVFFLHLTSGPDNTNNIMALAFGTLIVILVVAGSLWIMSHLNHNMMPMEQMMHRQP